MACADDVDALLAKAGRLAETAHAGQVDKAGAPYVEHPRRVAGRVRSTEEKIVALLHDTVEDSDVTLDALREAGFPPAVVAAVDALTKREGEETEAYLQRVMQNPLALRVKIADMQDNMDVTRIKAPSEKDRERLARYEATLPRLEAALRGQ